MAAGVKACAVGVHSQYKRYHATMREIDAGYTTLYGHRD
jgi:hypothetical protein